MPKFKRSVNCENTGCPLYPQKDFVKCEIRLPKRESPTDILFVGEAPGRDEADERYPFIGKPGQLLRQSITLATGGREVGFAFSYVVRCNPQDKQGNTTRPINVMSQEDIDYCKQFLLDDIEFLDPEVIVVLGNTAVTALLDDETPPNISRVRGQIHERKIRGKVRKLAFTWHPAYVLRNGRSLPLFNQDIAQAVRLSKGEELCAQESKIGTHRLLTTVEDVENYIYKELMDTTKKDYVSFDVETANLNKKHNNRLVMVQFAKDGEEGVCIPYLHKETPFSAEERERVHKALEWLFTTEVPFKAWIAHGSRFEQTIIGEHILGGRRIRNRPILDTLGGAFLLDENRTALAKELGGEVYGLKTLLKLWLGFDHYSQEDMDVRRSGGLSELALPRLAQYGAMDAYGTYRLFFHEAMMAREQNYYVKWIRLLAYLFSPVYRAISRMEANGFYVDKDHLHRLDSDETSIIRRRMAELEQNLRKFESAKKANKLALKQKNEKKGPGNMSPIFGGDPWVLKFNTNIDILFCDVLGLRAEKTKTGKRSISKDFYKEHEGVPEVELASEWAQLQKLSGAYVNQLKGFIEDHPDCEDSRVRPDFRFDNTVTGRTSSKGPNLQQLPKTEGHPARIYIKSMLQADQRRTEDIARGKQQTNVNHLKPGRGATFKTLAEPHSQGFREPRRLLVQLDYITAEIRWWAIMSGDENLAKIFNEGKRFRQEYAADPFNKEKRDKAKLAGDIHKMTAALMFGVSIENVTKEMRSAVKAIIFGLIYGRSVGSIAKVIKKTEEETQALCDQFADRFRQGWDWLEWAEDTAADKLWIESPVYRRRRLDAFMSNDNRLIAEAKRLARNSPIQSISSDASMLGSALFSDWIEDNKKDWLLVNSVHDSSVTDLPIDELREMVKIAKPLYEDEVMNYLSDRWGVKFNAPLEVEFEISQAPRHGWGDLVKWDFTEPMMDEIIAGARDPINSFIMETHIEPWLEKDESLTGSAIVRELNDVYPGVYDEGHAERFDAILAER